MKCLIYFVALVQIVLAPLDMLAYTGDSLDGPNFEFEESEFDFGDLRQGEKAEHNFVFKNTGNQPLIIENVLSTCGCTAPEWPKDPVLPGKEGSIKVVFDSSGKIGRQNKIITIRSNAVGDQHRIRIYGMVLPPEK
jgi:hypothetical protein